MVLDVRPTLYPINFAPASIFRRLTSAEMAYASSNGTSGQVVEICFGCILTTASFTNSTTDMKYANRMFIKEFVRRRRSVRLAAWEAAVLPLNYARKLLILCRNFDPPPRFPLSNPCQLCASPQSYTAIFRSPNLHSR